MPEVVPTTEVVPAEPETPPTDPGATPEPLGDGGKKALDSERRARSAAEKELNAMKAKLQEIEDAKLSDLEKAKKEADDFRATVAATAAENLRLKFAMSNAVPAAWIDRLRGSSEEELAADWAILQPTITPEAPSSRVPAPVPHQGPQPGSPQSEDDLLYARIYGSKK